MGSKVSNRKSGQGFTIVELLIVVVVIAILAAITIVSYNGITNRAKASAAQSAAESASKKVSVYAVTNSDVYPPDLATAGITDGNGTTYQYSVNNTATPATYCITATTSNISYYIDNASHSNPTVGACPGHGVNGVAPITNVATNPNATIYTPVGATGVAGWQNNRWFGSAPATGTYTLVTGASDGPAGLPTYMRKTWSAVNSSGDLGFNNGGSSTSTSTSNLPVQGGATYTFSSYLRSSVTYFGAQIQIWWHDSAGVYISTATSSQVSLSANSWQRLSLTTTAPANATSVGIVSDLDGQVPTVGMTLDGTGLMITQGSTLYNYADPTTASSWVWNGTSNSSTSTGPPL